jgi:hypothetical protein
MSPLRSPLHDLRVAAPCSAAWEQMEGDERVRFCDHCALHVYNLSTMTAQEAERLVVQKEGRLCVRFYQREDGTVMTQDCPRGLAAVRRAARRTSLMIGGAFAAMFLLVFGALGAAVGISNRGGNSNLNNVQPFKTIDNWLNGPPPVMGTPCPVENLSPHEDPPVQAPER